jgi:hypothetical protein
VSPEQSDAQESLCSIAFGQRARNVELGPGGGGGKGPKGKGASQLLAQATVLLAKAQEEARTAVSQAQEAEQQLKAAQVRKI